jgi:hypothetical protein
MTHPLHSDTASSLPAAAKMFRCASAAEAATATHAKLGAQTARFEADL